MDEFTKQIAVLNPDIEWCIEDEDGKQVSHQVIIPYGDRYYLGAVIKYPGEMRVRRHRRYSKYYLYLDDAKDAVTG